MWRVYCFSVLLALVVWAGVLSATAVQAQEVRSDVRELIRAEVIEVLDEYERDIMGTNTTTTVQVLRIVQIDGEKAGEVARLENDLTPVSPGDTIFVHRIVSIDGSESFVFFDVDRRMQLLYLAIFFVALVIIFAGKQGMRALISLAISLLAIFYILVPALLAGYSPALTSLGISAIILSVTIFITHGINPRATITFLGTMGAVSVTCLIAYLTVDTMRMTGFSSDASVFLNFATGGSLDIAGLLLGSIIIGLLGVLDDVSITQASVVQELRAANQQLRWYELYARAIRVGRDHVGSLVNTLALAYVGAALPLVLLYARVDSDVLVTLNQEVVAAEIVRIIIGSIGLILAVPFTTLMAAWYFKDKVVLDTATIHHCGHRH